MKRLWSGRFFYECKRSFRAYWWLYVGGLFLFLSGVLAGIYAANRFDSAYYTAILQTVMGYSAAQAYVLRTLKLAAHRVVCNVVTILFSNYIFMMPVALLLMVCSGAAWGVGMGCVFLLITKLKQVVFMPVFLCLFFMHAIPQISIFQAMLFHAKHTVQERRIPKSSTDLLSEFTVHFRPSFMLFLCNILASMVESAVLPLFLA